MCGTDRQDGLETNSGTEIFVALNALQRQVAFRLPRGHAGAKPWKCALTTSPKNATQFAKGRTFSRTITLPSQCVVVLQRGTNKW